MSIQTQIVDGKIQITTTTVSTVTKEQIMQSIVQKTARLTSLQAQVTSLQADIASDQANLDSLS